MFDLFTRKPDQSYLVNQLTQQNQQLREEVQQLTAQLSRSQQQGRTSQTISDAYEGESDLYNALGTYADSIKTMQKSLHALHDSNDKDQSSLHASRNTSEQTRDNVRTITSNMQTLSTDMQDAAKTIQSLNDRTNEIGSIVGIIADISEQTNLLALNAAIEAARAGDSGRGFAVVADEVRKLSNNTAQATTNISKLIKHIQKEVEHAQKQIEKATIQSDVLMRLGGTAEGSLTSLIDITEGMKDLIHADTLRMFITTAKMDHLAFKMDVYKAFMGLSETKAKDLSTHHTCRLGKWYYQGAGVKCYSKLDGYKQVETPHQRIHESAYKALTLFESGDRVAAAKALQVMEVTSIDVLEHLESIAIAGYQHRHELCSMES